ncbi:hypothetical protein REPUB_Repub06bG0064000 [Reevesia pubescens]
MKADRVIMRLHFEHWSRVDVVGFSGGIWVLWNLDLSNVNILHKIDQCITLVITSILGKVWALSAVYASLIPTVRETFWDFLRNFNDLDNMPWILIGDFNQIVSYSEKQGGGRESSSRMLKFLNVIQTRRLETKFLRKQWFIIFQEFIVIIVPCYYVSLVWLLLAMLGDHLDLNLLGNYMKDLLTL